MNRTIIGDCRESMRQLIADGMRVQMCVTSPPYWVLRDYGVAGQIGLERTVQEYVEKMVEVFRLVRELLADDGTLWLNLGDSYAQQGGPGWQGKNGQRADRKFTLVRDTVPMREASRIAAHGLKPKDLVGVPWRVAFALQADGWWLRQDIIWHKPNPMPESVTDRCTKAHEYLFLLSKSGRYYYDAEAIQEKAVQGEFRNRRSVWAVATEPYAEAHFATFPTELIEPCILAGSRTGDVVFDPFIGSGTTGQVAQSLGRRWLGCELNPEYVKLERKRTAQQGMAL